MKNLALVLAFLLAFQPIGFSASEWDKAKPAGTDDRSDLDTIIQVNNEAVDRLVSNYRRGMALAFATTATLTAGIGEVTCSNATGTVRRFRANTASTTITWADIDTGAEANSTTYYVYAVADADATTATFKISASATTPTGATYYKRLGSFYNNSSGDIESVTNDIAFGVVVEAGTVAHGGTIPLPSGYGQSQCKWMVGLGDLDGAYAARYFDIHVTANRLVTCQIGFNNWVDGGWSANYTGTANYIIVCS